MIEMDYDSAVGMHNPMTMEPAIQRDDDTHREDEPGDWFRTEFDGECSRGGEKFYFDDTIRADGDGGWECRECVDADGENSPFNVHGEDPYACF